MWSWRERTTAVNFVVSRDSLFMFFLPNPVYRVNIHTISQMTNRKRSPNLRLSPKEHKRHTNTMLQLNGIFWRIVFFIKFVRISKNVMKIIYLPLSPGLRTMLPTVEASSLSAAARCAAISSRKLSISPTRICRPSIVRWSRAVRTCAISRPAFPPSTGLSWANSWKRLNLQWCG